MSHHSRRRSGGDSWANVTPADLAFLDAQLRACWNGVDGSTHAPSSQVILGGSGLELLGPATVGIGGLLKSKRSSASGFQFALAMIGAVTFWKYAPPRARTMLWSLLEARGVPKFVWRPRISDGAFQSVSPSFDLSDGLGPQTSRLLMPLRLHQGATLTSVIVHGRVGWPHTTLPPTMPSARLIAIDSGGNMTTATTAAKGADSNGYVYLAKPTDTSWQTIGTPFSITLPVDNATFPNNGDMVDYSYYVDILEEAGQTGYPWSLVYTQPVKVASTGNLTLSGTQTIDGVACVVGDRVLAKNQTIANGNRIWIVQSGGWTVAPDLFFGAEFTRGMIVPIQQGSTNGGTYWQAATNQFFWDPIAGSLTFVPRSDVDTENATLAATHSFAHGNIFQCVEVTMSGITSGSFQ